MDASSSPQHRRMFDEALGALGVRRLLLAIHAPSFPSDPDEDVGAGSPGTRASARLLELVRTLGFTGIQLGPSGDTSRDNPSPYDATIFSRAIASVPKGMFEPGGELAGLVASRTLDGVRGDAGARGDHRRAHDVTRALVDEAWRAFEGGARPDLVARLAVFQRDHASWLEPDARFAAQRGTGPGSVEAYAFAQMIAHAAHERVQAQARALGLALYADLQVGYSEADAWSYAEAFLPGYAMGAPPSRTNPEGQAWNYPVLDPAQMAPGERAHELVRARAEKAFAEHDGLRIDHPHGLVCPWVYRTGGEPPGAAVRAGARLFESPDLPDHPALARFAVVRPDQLDRSLPRHADGWVRELSAAQVDRYAVLIDEVVATARRHGRAVGDLSCEVLSTLPLPLRRVLERHGLGRWRVFQKANLDDAADVYRTENAERQDWVMLGNHDTASIFGLIATWDGARRGRWADHLAVRLALTPAAASELAADDGLLASAMFAELLACRAENVLVFFADLFGFTERFNVPGTIDASNWSMRVPAAFDALYRERLAARRALDLPLALALALRARGAETSGLRSRLLAVAAAGRPLPAAVAAG